MLSKAQNKHIRSLSLQKYREEYGQFVAEGDKIAREWLQSTAEIVWIITTQKWHDAHEALINKHSEASEYIVEEAILSKISSLTTSHGILLVIKKIKSQHSAPLDEWTIALDELQDPGNMGSIIRIADWFGIKNIVCSPGCVDVYNPKVVQAAMGSHLRINFFEEDLVQFCSDATIPVLATVLNGENIYNISKPEKAVLLIGNEGKGISDDLINLANQKITIPSKGGAESLNVAVATGIVCALLHAV